MIREILRFNREAMEFLKLDDHKITLGEYLNQNKFSTLFQSHYIMPMGAAIWSTAPKAMESFPARYFIEFFKNHGMLSVNDRPQWRVIQGGSKSYISKLVAKFKDKIRLNAKVTGIRRADGKVFVSSQGRDGEETFDSVILACHSDQALRILRDADNRESEVLGGFSYLTNSAVLHTDQTILPKSRLAWGAWNYKSFRNEGPDSPAIVTYNMNILQTLNCNQTYCVTLNADDRINPEKIIKKFRYHHPGYSIKSLQSQKRHAEINGVRQTFFCGAYWGFGFHEDGVNSALAVTEKYFGKRL